MERFRKVLFWCHLLTGAVAGAVVLVMSVTGVLLTYQKQITTWADLRGLEGGPPNAAAARLPLGELVRRVTPAGGPAPTSVVLRPGPDVPVQVAFGRERTVFANAYTGAVLSEGAVGVRRFFRVATDWHRWLGRAGDSRAWGRAVTGAANLGFLFLVLSGLYLWWPRNRSARAFGNVLRFRRGLRGKARDFNWHNVIGIWSAVPLAVVVASGVVISYGWAGDLVYRLAGEAPPPGGRRGAPGPDDAAPGAAELDALAATAAARVPGWKQMTLSLAPAGDTVRITVDRGNGGQPQHRVQVALSAASGEIVAAEPFSASSPGRRARMILRFAHTGEVLGVAGQTLAGLVSAGAVVLVWTGVALSLRRLLAWRRRGGGGRKRPEPRAGRRRHPRVRGEVAAD